MARKDRQLTRPRVIDPARRVILPPEVLTALDVDVGEYVAFELDQHGVRLKKVTFTVS